MKKLLSVAYKQIELLNKVQEPTAETYMQMASLVTCIDYMQRDYSTQKSELSEMLIDLQQNLGDKKTLEMIVEVITEFNKDLDLISPHLSKCFINKLKEKLQR